MLRGVASNPSLRFRRGGKSIVDLYNKYCPDAPIDEKGLYKRIAKGLITVGREGKQIFVEENDFVGQLRRNAGVAPPETT